MKRPLWRRLVRIALNTLASVIVVLLILLGVLHTSIGKNFVRGRIAAKLASAVDGTAELGSVDYGFLFSHVELKDLVIHDRDGKAAITIAALHVVVDRGSLLHGAPVIEDLALDGLEAAIVQTADGRTNLTGLFKASGSPPPASITVSKLHLTGAAHVTRPDGTVITIAELVIEGSATVKPRAQLADVSLSGISAQVTLAVPKAPVRTLELAIGTVLLAQRAGAVEATVGSVSFGALTIERIHAALAVVAGKPAGAQAISITNAKLDHQKLSTMLGKELFLDDVKLDAALTGPLDKLVIHGGVVTRQTTLDLDGTLDLSRPALPRYDVMLVGKGTSTDLLAHAPPNVPPIQTDVKLAVVGSGLVVPDLDANLTLEVGPTQLGSISVEGVSARAHAQKGGLVLERLHAKGLGFTIDASGDVAADTTLHGSLTVAGSPVEASRVLRAAGIAASYRVPLLPHVEVTVTAAGKPEGELLLEVRPMQVPIAGGSVSMAGTAALEHRIVTRASTTIGLHGLDLGALARLAHKPAPKVKGSLSGSVAVQLTGDVMAASYDLTIALHDPEIVAQVHGKADRAAADLAATIIAHGTSLAKITAHLAHDDQGLLPDRGWKVSIDAPPRALTELLALAPSELRATLAIFEGDVALHGDLAGTPNHPTGSIQVIAHVATPAGPQVAQIRAVLAGQGAGTKIATHVELAPLTREKRDTVRDPYAQPRAHGTAVEDAMPFVVVDGAVTLPRLFRGRQLDVIGLRSGIAFDEVLVVPDHELAHLPLVTPQIARLGGTLGGSATITGTPFAPHVRAAFAWRGYPIISGLGTTELTLAGTPLHLEANVTSGPLAIHSSITRAGDHLAVETLIHADPAPVAAMVPASLVPDLHGVQPGTLRSDLSVKLALVLNGKKLSLEDLDVTGSLSIKEGAFAIPNTDRRWHDLELELEGTPDGVKLTQLSAHEDPARSLQISGFFAVKKAHDAAGALVLEPDRAHLEVAIHDWLALGFGPPLLSDAPIATVNLAARVDANLSLPVIALDATISKLDFAQPDRLEHSHEPEQWQVTGDVIYSADKSGALPVAPVRPGVASAPHHVVPLDVKIHIPHPIHVLKSPLELFAKGELTVAVRDTGIETRGAVEVTGGKLQLFHRDHHVVSGSIVFDDAHPHGNFALAFQYELPPEVVRELAHSGARVDITGPPTKPLISFGGAVNSTLAEALTTYHAGHPVYLSWPGLYPSATTEVQSGYTYYIFGFLSNALPHLLFLDRAIGWVDPNEPRGAYGRIRNLELEGYASDRSARARVVARPTEPGRSTAELQLDHLWIDGNQLLVGAGVRAGDRLGGGVGLFFEWSSNQ